MRIENKSVFYDLRILRGDFSLCASVGRLQPLQPSLVQTEYNEYILPFFPARGVDSDEPILPRPVPAPYSFMPTRAVSG